MAMASSPSAIATGTPPTVADLDAACMSVVNYRRKPLLVLYYPPRATMNEDDLEDVYSSFREAGTSVESKLSSLDVLVESNGGNPVAGYRLAQLVRDFSEEVFFLVADHAYSAATLLCFAGNGVRLAHYAGLSPIDITLIATQGRTAQQEVELANIDNFLEFAKKCRKTIEEMLRRVGMGDGKTEVDSDLLVEMVKEVGALQVGKYFRERMLTGRYARGIVG